VPGAARAEHEVVQDVHGVAAVLADGVDVAADVEAVLGDVVAGQAAGYLLLGFRGRTPRSLHECVSAAPTSRWRSS
jgi:hypothetical protein